MDENDAADFLYRERKDGQVFLYFRGRHVETLQGRDANRFLERAAGADDAALQLLMAKATRNFKRGNERLANERGRR